MKLQNEPVMIAAAIRAVIVAAIAFGLDMTPEQMGSLMLAVEAILAVVTRSQVTPNQLAEHRVDMGYRPTEKITDAGPKPQV